MLCSCSYYTLHNNSNSIYRVVSLGTRWFGYELAVGTSWSGYKLVLGTCWLGYELARYDLVRVRVDRHPVVQFIERAFCNRFISPKSMARTQLN